MTPWIAAAWRVSSNTQCAEFIAGICAEFAFIVEVSEPAELSNDEGMDVVDHALHFLVAQRRCLVERERLAEAEPRVDAIEYDGMPVEV